MQKLIANLNLVDLSIAYGMSEHLRPLFLIIIIDLDRSTPQLRQGEAEVLPDTGC